MSHIQHPWDDITNKWNEDHPGWEVIDFHNTMLAVPLGESIDGTVAKVKSISVEGSEETEHIVTGVGSDLISALNDVNHILNRRSQG